MIPALPGPTLTFDSPLGPITITERNGALARLVIRDEQGRDATPLLDRTRDQIAAYFAGTRTTFDLPLAPPPSPFQARMRAAMIAIPFGQTRSYGDLARTLGSAPRAIGRACGGNPIPIVVPCHRVLAAHGKLGGFSADGGVDTKRWLLTHESAAPQQSDLFAPVP